MALGYFVFKNNDGQYIKPQKSIKDSASFTRIREDGYRVASLSQANEFINLIFREKRIMLHKEWVDV